MGKKRSNLPVVTSADIAERRDQLRLTPTGGYGWKCGLCGRFASSQTVKGEFRCSRHGGTTARQRDPLSPKRPPGRPIKTGFYSRGEKVNIQALVEEYRAQGLDVDDSDEDMRHLRARLQNDLQLEPKMEELEGQLEALIEALVNFGSLKVEGEEMNLQAALTALGEGDKIASQVKATSRLLAQVKAFTREIKADHERLVKLGKVRAETRRANHVARQLDAFVLLVGNFMTVLEEMLRPDDYAALQVRIRKDFKEVSARATEPKTIDLKN